MVAGSVGTGDYRAVTKKESSLDLNNKNRSTTSLEPRAAALAAAALFVPEISIWFAWMVAGSVGTGDYRAVTFFVGHGGYCMDKTLSCYKKMY